MTTKVMKIKKYNAANGAIGRRNVQEAIVSFSENGSIRFNRAAGYLTGLNDGSLIEFWNDEESPRDWYLVKTTDKVNGLKVRTNKTNICVNNIAVVEDIQKTTGVSGKVMRFPLSRQKQVIEGHECYLIITANRSELATKVMQLGS